MSFRVNLLLKCELDQPPNPLPLEFLTLERTTLTEPARAAPGVAEVHRVARQYLIHSAFWSPPPSMETPSSEKPIPGDRTLVAVRAQRHAPTERISLPPVGFQSHQKSELPQ